MAIDAREFKQRHLKKLKGINLSSKCRDANWLAKQVRRGLTPELAEKIPLIAEAAEIAFPGKWDIQFKFDIQVVYATLPPYGYWTFNEVEFHRVLTNNKITEEHLYSIDNTYVSNYIYQGKHNEPFVDGFRLKVIPEVKLVIHFPEVTITNKYHQSHLIKDLFISLKFDSEATVSTEIQGNRSTYSELEIVGGYCHSHLRAKKFNEECGMQWQAFCKGSSGHIISCLSFYNADKSLGNLVSLIMHLNTTANHESIDGGPHYRMEQLMAKEGLAREVGESVKQEAFRAIISNIHHNVYKRNVPSITIGGRAENILPLDWKYVDNKYLLVDNEKLNDFCTYYLKHNDRVGRSALVYKADNGEYYLRSSSLGFNRDDYPDFEGQSILFRGQWYDFNVYQHEGPKIKDKKLYIHPSIKEYVKLQLELQASKTAFKQSAIERLDQIGNH